MKVTIAICTLNRCRLLERTLESLCELAIPDGLEWSVLVVDNGSEDSTPEILETFADRLPIRSVLESRQGLAQARNRAISEATGDYILWTDDDVLVGEQWLSAYAAAFDRWRAAVFFGGPIIPQFESPSPKWLQSTKDLIAGAYAHRDLGSQPMKLTGRAELPYGANMAFRLEDQRQYSYDPDLGRKGTSLIGSEELQVMERLLADGKHGRWVPGARVLHLIPSERQTRRYLRRYFVGTGRSAHILRDFGQDPMWGDRPRWAYRAAMEEEAKYWLYRILGKPRKWVAHMKMASFAQGILMGPPKDVKGQR